MIAKILASLPSKFRNIRTIWNSVDPERQTLENLQERLIEEELYLNAETVETNALTATSNKNVDKGDFGSIQSRRGIPRRQDKKDNECYVCSKKGHYARECPAQHNQCSTEQGDESAAMCEYSALSATTATVILTVKKKDDSNARSWAPSVEQKKQLLRVDIADVWFLNSGASAHVTYRREWFSEYRLRRERQPYRAW